MRQRTTHTPLNQSPMVSPSKSVLGGSHRAPKLGSLFQPVIPAPSTEKEPTNDLFRSLAHDIEEVEAIKLPNIEDFLSNDDEKETSFMAISKSVQKPAVGENNEAIHKVTPQSSKSSFHSAQESPSFSENKNISSKSPSPLPSSSPILAPNREIMQIAEEEQDKTIYSTKTVDTPKSVKVPLKDESESTFGFARLPAREPFTKKSLGKMPSRERSWLDIKPPAVLAAQAHDSIESALEVKGPNSVKPLEVGDTDSIEIVEDETIQLKPALPLEIKEIDRFKDFEDDTITAGQSISSGSTSNTQASVTKVNEPTRKEEAPLEKTYINSMLISDTSAEKVNDIDMVDVGTHDLVSAKSQESTQLTATPSKGSLFRSKSKKNEGNATPNNLFSATFGAFRKAKKLLFEGHEDKEKNKSPEAKSPPKHKMFPIPNTNIPRSPLRSPSRNQAKSPVQSTVRKETPSTSPSKKLDPFSRLMAPTFSSSARQQEVQQQSETPSSVKKSLYPEIPKLFHDKIKVSKVPRSPSPERHPLLFESSAPPTASSRLKDISMQAMQGSEPPSPVKSAKIPEILKPRQSPSKADVVVASKTRSATANNNMQNFDSSVSTFPKYGAPTPSRTATGKLTKQTLVKRTNTTPGPKQAPMPIRVPMASHREMEQRKGQVSKPVVESKAGIKQPLTAMSLSKPKVAGGLYDDDKKKDITTETFSSKFKAALSGKPGKDTTADGPKMLRKTMQTEDDKYQKSTTTTMYKPFMRDSISGKRTSETAFGSPAERTSISNGSSLRGPPTKKPSFGPSSSLMKTALKHQAKSSVVSSSKAPYIDGVKFSNDKIKFGPSAATTALSTATSYQRPPSIISTTSTSSKSSFASMSSLNNNGGSQFQAMHQSHQQQSTSSNSHNLLPPTTPGPSTTVLPDIFSESEDDDDGSVILDWANSPELRSMLLRQQQVDPDSVFGPIAPLQMDEVFRSSRLSRFRPRSSSANWSGQDKLSQQEIESYAKEMGYNK